MIRVHAIKWKDITNAVKGTSEAPVCGIWTDGDQIMCRSEVQADAVADLLEAMGFSDVCTGYYDPKEDEYEGVVDEYTGQWYVSV